MLQVTRMFRVAALASVAAACSPGSGIDTPDATQNAPDAAPMADAPLPPPPPVFAQTAYIKSTRPLHDAHFGQPALSASGDTLVATQPGTVSVYTRDGTWRVEGELTASESGSPVAISSDGTTIAIGGMNNADTSSVDVFRRVDDVWTLDGHFADLPSGDFPTSIAINRDGTLFVVGMRSQSTDTGRVYTYRRRQAGWSKIASLGGSSGDWHFGSALALSSDGSVLAAYGHSAVQIYGRTNDTWTKRATLVSPAPAPQSMFGESISCSAQCRTIVVGDEQPPPMMPPGDPGGIGAAYVFDLDGATWVHTATLAPSNGEPGVAFGFAVAVSEDGSTIVAGAPKDDDGATGINMVGAEDGALYSGAAYVYRRFHGAWWQVMYLKASNAEWIDIFGRQVAISKDGRTIAAAAPNEPSSASGVGGDQSDNSLPYAGAVYIFEGTY